LSRAALARFALETARPLYALDCEMVLVQHGERATRSALGRVSVVDSAGQAVVDCFVRPEAAVVDYLTRWSGIQAAHMADAMPFAHAQALVRQLLHGARVVGHAVANDFRALRFQPAEIDAVVFDTEQAVELRAAAGFSLTQRASLKRLYKQLYQREIQQDSHCSLADAKVTPSPTCFLCPRHAVPARDGRPPSPCFHFAGVRSAHPVAPSRRRWSCSST
jgi:hypothetical protein